MLKNMEIDRQADLLYAFQYGQDFARTGDSSIKDEFNAKFAGDVDAHVEFDKGVADVQAKAGHLN